MSRGGGALPVEWSSLISWTNHSTLRLCLERRVGTLPTALLAAETAGKGENTYTAGPVCAHGKVQEPF